ncbi:MAG: DUF5723 family protein [Brumimicrobium sp.]
MKKVFLISLFSLLFSFGVSHVNSQNYLGVINSNYAGVMGTDLQPASFVDGRFMVDINLFSINIDAWQNAKYFDASILPKRNWPYSLRKDTEWMDNENLYEESFHNVVDYNSPKLKNRGSYIGGQLDLLNFMFHINPRIAVGFTAKLRFINNIDRINPQILKLSEEGLDFNPLWHTNIEGELLSQNSLAWAEYGLNYSQVVWDNKEHFVKAGIKVKFNQGIASTYLHSRDLEFQLMNSDTATTFRGEFGFGYSGNVDEYMVNSTNSFNDIFKLTSKLGIGFDIGGVYEWRPDYEEYQYDMDGETNLWRRDKNKYKIRAGISLLDIGGMKFEKGGKSRDFSVNTTNLDLTIFDKVETPGDFASIIDSLIQNDPDWVAKEDTLNTFFVNTPTALSFQFDWNIWNNFHVGAIAYLNINGKKNNANVRVPNQFSITPGYDHKWFGVGIPISYHQFGGFRVGLGLRLGPLTLGVPDLKTIFPGGKIRGAGFYAGLRVPIPYGAPKDRDGDMVSDKKDDCIDTPGVWAFKGCPDTDGDGIPDHEDECPTVAGPKELNGCPDTDGDGIPDHLDRCPDIPGIPEFEGCPDTDGDGITDSEDECPELAGIPEFNGCPDTDGDGIPDHKDACPDQAGSIEFDGCPDTDGDGIPDHKDQCPNIAGPAENNGCPWADRDGDGIPDQDDECPDLPGLPQFKGCPDTDGDGVPDHKDDCPNTPGLIENNGCPEIDEEAKEILKVAFDNLEFETAKAVIKEDSYPSLNGLADVLKKKPEWKLQISGHTDNVGNAQKNMVLSKNRAESVQKFLMERGIDKDRFNVLYFGDTQPIAPNNTAEGRQKNRRVEMKIIFD